MLGRVTVDLLERQVTAFTERTVGLVRPDLAREALMFLTGRLAHGLRVLLIHPGNTSRHHDGQDRGRKKLTHWILLWLCV